MASTTTKIETYWLRTLVSYRGTLEHHAIDDADRCAIDGMAARGLLVRRSDTHYDVTDTGIASMAGDAAGATGYAVTVGAVTIMVVDIMAACELVDVARFGARPWMLRGLTGGIVARGNGNASQIDWTAKEQFNVEYRAARRAHGYAN